MKSFVIIASIIEDSRNKKGCPCETAIFYDKMRFETLIYSTTTLRVKFPLFDMIFSI
jgi:hypothetical protein